MPVQRPGKLVRGVSWSVIGLAVLAVVFGPELFPGNSRLYDAIDAGDQVRVAGLIQNGLTPDSRSSEIRALLVHAGAK